MDRIHLMAVFIAVGEEQSFAAAARRLGMSRPGITRAIASLEETVGVKLLLRTTRSVRLTEAGSRYLDDVRIIMAKIAEADEVIAGSDTLPQGHLNITASVLFGAAFVTPCIVEYLLKFPEMTVSTYFLDRVVNLVEEGMDVALRIGHVADASLKAVQVGQVRRVLCATPQYLARHGIPRHPDELSRHAIIAATGISPDIVWKFGRKPHELAIRVAPRLTVASNDAAIEAALLGVGLTRLLSYQVAGHLDAGRLQIVLADHEETPLPVQLLYREDRYGAPKMRELIDLLVRRLGGDAHLN